MTYRRRLLNLLGIRDPGHPWIVRAQRLRRKILRTDERLRDNYLKSVAVPKLQIGGGWNRLDGWLNTDLALRPGVMLMDATERFPFPDETFQFIYTEHMIEHVSYEQGVFMLQECYRVMLKGAVIRVTTPNLATITDLCNENLTDMQQKYLSWICRTFVSHSSTSRRAFAINVFFRLWGHQFIYDEETLADVLSTTGFSSVKRHRLRISDWPTLQNLERTDRYPEGLLDFESLALEAVK